jgi:hypothetical protein
MDYQKMDLDHKIKMVDLAIKTLGIHAESLKGIHKGKELLERIFEMAEAIASRIPYNPDE